MIPRPLFRAAVCLACLLFCACAPRLRVAGSSPKTGDGKPNANSIYYFLSASLAQKQGDLEGALQLYKRALQFDPGSFQIKKQTLLVSIGLYAQQILSEEEVNLLIAFQAYQMGFDEDMLLAVYGFYDQSGNREAQEKTLRELEKRFPSANASMQRFIFEYKNNGQTQLKYLDQAFKQARNDPQSLGALSNLLLYFDVDRALQVLFRMNEIAPSPEAHNLLASIIINKRDATSAQRYFSTLGWPKDREAMGTFVRVALETGNHDLIIAVAEQLLDSGDIDLLHSLAFAALVRGRPDVLKRVSLAAQASLAPEHEKQSLYALFIGHSLAVGEIHPLDSQAGKLLTSQAYGEIYSYYGLGRLKSFPRDVGDITGELSADFATQVEKRFAPGAGRDYLLAVARSAADSSYAGYADAKKELVEHLRQITTLRPADYEFLLQYHHNWGDASLRRSLLSEAVEKYPDNPVFANDLGYTLLLEGADPREAARLIQVALDAEPENPFYLDSMAWSHYLAGDYARAEELMAIPAQMEDMPAEIAWHLGAIYLKLGNLERAKEFLSLCVSIGGDQECVTEARHALRQLP